MYHPLSNLFYLKEYSRNFNNLILCFADNCLCCFIYTDYKDILSQGLDQIKIYYLDQTHSQHSPVLNPDLYARK